MARWKARDRLPIIILLIELLSPALKYWSKLWCLKEGGHFERKFPGEGGRPPSNFGIRKLESLGYHVVLFVRSYV